MIETYQTLSAPNQAEFKDKGSRFIAFAYPIRSTEEVKQYVDTLRQEHHKARHWCYAYRLGVDGNQFRANDDGEPSGSAGRPILGQIDSAELTDVLVVVVRYFGGTLLGVPGLIHAYKTSTQMALQSAQIIQKKCGKDGLCALRLSAFARSVALGKNSSCGNCGARFAIRLPFDRAYSIGGLLGIDYSMATYACGGCARRSG